MADIRAAITRKIGPLPVWAWGGIIGGGILAYGVLSGKGATSPFKAVLGEGDPAGGGGSPIGALPEPIEGETPPDDVTPGPGDPIGDLPTIPGPDEPITDTPSQPAPIGAPLPSPSPISAPAPIGAPAPSQRAPSIDSIAPTPTKAIATPGTVSGPVRIAALLSAPIKQTTGAGGATAKAATITNKAEFVGGAPKQAAGESAQAYMMKVATAPIRLVAAPKAPVKIMGITVYTPKPPPVSKPRKAVPVAVAKAKAKAATARSGGTGGATSKPTAPAKIPVPSPAVNKLPLIPTTKPLARPGARRPS